MRKTALLLSILFLAPVLRSETSEIAVNLRLDGSDFIVGERVRGVVDIANSSPDKISYGYSNSRDRFFIEVFRSGDLSALTRISTGEFVSRFRIESNEGQKLETFLADHYALNKPDRYLAKPVLVHNGVRYEGQMRAFDIVPGVKISSAMQLFANHDGLQREFELVFWSRRNVEHLFLKAWDTGTGNRRWETRDLGPILRIDKPSVSVLSTGEVIVLHRINQDQFVRSELWSLPNALEFRTREAVQDPETAGTARVRELYKDKGVKPNYNPWWKFW